MTTATVHAITDQRTLAHPALHQRAASLARGGAALHARGRELSGQAHHRLAAKFAACIPDVLYVNDRVDIALLVGAAGVVLGEASLPVSAVRSMVGTKLQIGRSVHDPGAALEAVDAGADFLIAGSVFPTPSHPGRLPLGLDGVRAMVDLGRPVIAIGGITLQNAGQVRDCGASGIAAIRALWDSPNPGEAARSFREIFACAL